MQKQFANSERGGPITSQCGQPEPAEYDGGLGAKIINFSVAIHPSYFKTLRVERKMQMFFQVLQVLQVLGPGTHWWLDYDCDSWRVGPEKPVPTVSCLS